MLISTKCVLDCFVENEEGTVGRLEDLLFDDESWTVRYLVVETGGWIYQHQVLLRPESIEVGDWPNRCVRTRLSHHELEEAPDVSSHRPVSQHKSSFTAQYPSWPSIGTFSPLAIPDVAPADDEPGEPHLRSIQDVIGYRMEASEGEVGHLAELILNEPARQQGSWAFEGLVVDRGYLLPGRKVVLAPRQVSAIVCDVRTIYLAMTRKEVDDSPAFQPNAPENHRIEDVLYDYYGKRRGVVLP
jgi:hypothetical protein